MARCRYLSQLPEGILSQVLTFLDFPDLRNLYSVSKQFRDIVKSYMRRRKLLVFFLHEKQSDQRLCLYDPLTKQRRNMEAPPKPGRIRMPNFVFGRSLLATHQGMALIDLGHGGLAVYRPALRTYHFLDNMKLPEEICGHGNSALGAAILDLGFPNDIVLAVAGFGSKKITVAEVRFQNETLERLKDWSLHVYPTDKDVESQFKGAVLLEDGAVVLLPRRNEQKGGHLLHLSMAGLTPLYLPFDVSNPILCHEQGKVYYLHSHDERGKHVRFRVYQMNKRLGYGWTYIKELTPTPHQLAVHVDRADVSLAPVEAVKIDNGWYFFSASMRVVHGYVGDKWDRHTVFGKKGRPAGCMVMENIVSLSQG